MITPSFNLTATERVLPRLALDFTTAVLDPRITFTRSGNTATVTDSTGVIVGVNADVPRFDYDPVSLVCKGLLIEETRTNALLNSLIDGTSLATQSVTVTAAARTLSFYGTGEVVLSGAHSATVTGTGAYPVRTTLTFTPSAGTLTLTVTGTVQFAQLEVGPSASSFIPTAGAAVTRNLDVATMTGANFSSWFNPSEGAFVAEGSPVSNAGSMFSVHDGSFNNYIAHIFRFGNSSRTWVFTSNVEQVNLISSASGSVTHCFGYKVNDYAQAINGGTVVTDTTASVPTVNQLSIGARVNGNQLNGTIAKLMYWSPRIINAEVQAFSK